MVLSMPLFQTIVLSPLMLENNDLFPSSLGCYPPHYLHSRHSGGSHFHPHFIVLDQEDLVQFDLFPYLTAHLLHLDEVPFAHLILLATGFNNSVNLSTSTKSDILPVTMGMCQVRQFNTCHLTPTPPLL